MNRQTRNTKQANTIRQQSNNRAGMESGLEQEAKQGVVAADRVRLRPHDDVNYDVLKTFQKQKICREFCVVSLWSDR